MSCIAGLYHAGGDPVDPAFIERMLLRMHGRAPDGNQALCAGAVGFGNAFLRTGSSKAEAQGAMSLDGKVWITADARIDGRAELLRKLRVAGRQVSDDAPHAELILHAYLAFGKALLSHLIGDFAFAIWDAARRELICGRDHFGVRPFCYFESPGVFCFASDIDALLLHPRVSRRLDDASVADFLVFGALQDDDRTIYADIRCLPPASMLVLSGSGLQVSRYWQVPAHPETRLPDAAAYVQRFQELFEQAVRDRLPGGALALQLSGGLDSTAIAAVARSHTPQGRMTAYNLCAKSVVPEDEERHFAEVAARHLDIPLVSQDLGRYSTYERHGDPELATASPLVYPHLAAHYDTLQQIAKSGARVLFSGHGGDALFAPSASYYPGLLRTRRMFKLFKEVSHHVRHTGSLAGMGLRSALRPRPATAPWSPAMPDWIEPSFAARAGLQSRWNLGWKTVDEGVDAYHQLSQRWLSRHFEAVEILKLPVITRHPFYDVRLVEFMLGLPNFMLARKRVLREAIRAKLPESIWSRPKTPMPGDVMRAIVTKRKRDFLAQLDAEGPYPEQVIRERYMTAFASYCEGTGSDSTWNNTLILAPVALKNWLSNVRGESKDE